MCLSFHRVCSCLVAKLCPTLCNPMDCSMPGSLFFTVFWSLLKLTFIELMMPSNHLILCHPFLLLSSASGPFPMSQLFISGGQNIGASALILPMNIQLWFPLRLTGLISWLSKGFSRVFSNTTVQKHSLGLNLSYGPNFTSVHDYWKNHSFDYMDLCQQSDLCFLVHCLGLS